MSKIFSWTGAILISFFAAVLALHYEYDFLQKRGKPAEDSSQTEKGPKKRPPEEPLDDTSKDQGEPNDTIYIYVDTSKTQSKGDRLISLLKDSFIIDSDGNKYPLLKFNNLIWTGKNLNLIVSDSRCYQDQSKNCLNYGRLYFWESAMQACQSLGMGWRLPTDKEWEILAEKHGGFWDLAPDESYLPDNETHGNPLEGFLTLIEKGESDFNAQLGGSFGLGAFYGENVMGRYWTAGSKTLYRFKVYFEFRKERTESRLVRDRGFGRAQMAYCRCVRK